MVESGSSSSVGVEMNTVESTNSSSNNSDNQLVTKKIDVDDGADKSKVQVAAAAAPPQQIVLEIESKSTTTTTDPNSNIVSTTTTTTTTTITTTGNSHLALGQPPQEKEKENHQDESKQSSETTTTTTITSADNDRDLLNKADVTQISGSAGSESDHGLGLVESVDTSSPPPSLSPSPAPATTTTTTTTTSSSNNKTEINSEQTIFNPNSKNNSSTEKLGSSTSSFSPINTGADGTPATTTTTTTTTNNYSNNDPNNVKNSSDGIDVSFTDSPSKSKLSMSQKLDKNKLKRAERRLSYRPKSSKYEHKKNVLGEIIYKGHPSWELMLNIQIGIRNAVGKSMGTNGGGTGTTPHQFHTLRTPKDFKNRADFYNSPKELRFDTAGSQLTEAHSTGPFKFKDYCPIAFRYLRYQFGIDQADFLVSLCNTQKNGENALRELPTPGKSGSLFFFSHDMKFIIKTIPKDEAKLLRQLLPAYTDHLTSNPNTLLPRFFGLFRVKPHGGRQVRFVVMGNNFPTRKKIHERYDLKGSIVGREASENEKKSETVTFKDIDFRNKNKKICIGPQKRAAFLDQIKKDCALLESLNIMDYSLLVGIHYASRDPPSPSLMRHGLAESMDDSPIMSRSMKNMEQSMADMNEVYTQFQQDEGGLKGVGEDGVSNDEHYFMGIIDILMLYSLRKKVEHAYKTLKFGGEAKHEISSVSPEEYSQRFQDFLSTIIV